MSHHPDAYRHNRGLAHSGSNGFTLVEVLVALTLLTVGLVPAFNQASQAIVLAGTVRNSLIATHLAQEGVEVVRSMRDANWFVSKPFDENMDICAGGQPASSGCRVQWDSQTLLSPAGNPPLKFDTVSGLYQYTTGQDTLFTRLVTVTAVGDHELKIVAQIDWRERSGPKTFSLEYHIFDWLQL